MELFDSSWSPSASIMINSILLIISCCVSLKKARGLMGTSVSEWVLVARVSVLSVTYTHCCRQTDSIPPTQSYCGSLRSHRRWRARTGPPRAQNTSAATWPCRGPSLRSQNTPLTGHTHTHADTHEEQRLMTWELVVDQYIDIWHFFCICLPDVTFILKALWMAVPECPSVFINLLSWFNSSA